MLRALLWVWWCDVARTIHGEVGAWCNDVRYRQPWDPAAAGQFRCFPTIRKRRCIFPVLLSVAALSITTRLYAFWLQISMFLQTCKNKDQCGISDEVLFTMEDIAVRLAWVL
eukprot:SAG11_NODE_197_length_12691_cov_20.904145_10_plen_112_part_00